MKTLSKSATAAHNLFYELREKKQALTEPPTFKKVLKESWGGRIYNLANKGKYESDEILKIWTSLTDSEKDSFDGIESGAIRFILNK